MEVMFLPVHVFVHECPTVPAAFRQSLVPANPPKKNIALLRNENNKRKHRSRATCVDAIMAVVVIVWA